MSDATLHVLCWDHPRCTGPMRAAARIWEQEHPAVTVTVSARPLDAFNDQPLRDIAAEADLLVIDHPMVGVASRQDALLPLDDLVEPRELAALGEDGIAGSHGSYTWDGRQWATAIDVACQVAVASDGGLAALDAAVPTRWAEVLDLARRAPGSVAIPLHPTDAILSLLTMSANSAEHPEMADGLITESAVELLIELAAHVDPRSFGLNPPRLLDLMSGGPSGEVPAYAPLTFGYTDYQRPGARTNPLRFCDIPSVTGDTTGSVLGGAGLAVSAGSRAPQVAAAFAVWMAGARTQREVVLPNGGQPGSRATWDDPAADAVVGGFFSGTRRTVDGSWIRPRAGWWPEYQRLAGMELVRSLKEHEGAAGIRRSLTTRMQQMRAQEAY